MKVKVAASACGLQQINVMLKVDGRYVGMKWLQQDRTFGHASPLLRIPCPSPHGP